MYNPELANTRTPINNLYLGGANSHPGGLVTFGAGYSLANVVAEDLGAESELKPIALDLCSITYRGRSGEYKTAIMDQTTGQDPTPFFDWWELDAKEREDALQVLPKMISLPPEKVGCPG